MNILGDSPLVGAESIASGIHIAFQPIVKIGLRDEKIVALEALARTSENETRPEWTSSMSPAAANLFDYACRLAALRSAIVAKIDVPVCLNIDASAFCDKVYGVAPTLEYAEKIGWPRINIIFELTEHTSCPELAPFYEMVNILHKHGARWALDDFGTGFCRLPLICQQLPDFVKLDINMLRTLESAEHSNGMLESIILLLRDRNVNIIAEGVESREQRDLLCRLGIFLHQGYYYSPPVLVDCE